MSLVSLPTNLVPLPARLAPGDCLVVRAQSAGQMTTPDSTLRLRYYHQDHLGSSSSLTTSTGAMAQQTAFYPFGQVRCDFVPGNVAENYEFTQKERDAESGLHYFGARFLSPLARFTRVDPVVAADPPSALLMPKRLNGYAYVNNSPLVLVDHDGMQDDDSGGGDDTGGGDDGGGGGGVPGDAGQSDAFGNGGVGRPGQAAASSPSTDQLSVGGWGSNVPNLYIGLQVDPNSFNPPPDLGQHHFAYSVYRSVTLGQTFQAVQTNILATAPLTRSPTAPPPAQALISTELRSVPDCLQMQRGRSWRSL